MRTVFFQPMLDRRNECIQLRTPDRRTPLIAGRCRIGHHLGHAVARYVEMLSCLALRHSFRNSQPNPQIKFHGVDPLSLLRSLQKGNRWPDFTPPAAGLFRRYRGRLLHRRSQIFSAVRNLFVASHKKRSALTTHIHRVRATAQWNAVTAELV